MQPPVFLCDATDVLAFQSVQEMEGFIEPPDVDEGRAFDAVGRLLSVTADGSRTVVSDAEDLASHQDELRAALMAALTAAGDQGVEAASFEELVVRAADRFAAPSRPGLMSVVKSFVIRCHR